MTIGTLFIISAPSGGGKTSLVNGLISQLHDVEVSISHTTRPMRPGEKNEVNYHFVNVPVFQGLIEKKAFLEYAEVFGNYYGTSKEWVENKLKQGTDVILEIDWQGARQIRQLMPESVGIFILPPSWEELEGRLKERAQDDSRTIEKRMAAAKAEMMHYAEYDYLVINDDFKHALQDLKSIIQARRLRIGPQNQKYTALIAELLA